MLSSPPDWAVEFVREAHVGRLATSSADAEPHVIPCVYALLDGAVYSVVDEKPKSADALLWSPGAVDLVRLSCEDDERTATCSCPRAGNNGVVCWHSAACAVISGMLTQPAPVDVVVEEVRPDELELAAADFDLGDILTGRFHGAMVAAGQLS